METTPEYPTWQIFPDAGKQFRWKFSGQDPNSISQNPNNTSNVPQNPSSCLPSMSDLLLQGSSKLFQDENVNVHESSPMFRTASGKSVAVKQSSIRTALSVLGEGSSKLLHDENGNGHDSSPMFRTASGKSVALKQSSIRTALSVLGDEEITKTGSSKLIQVENGNGHDSSPMFRTASGKSVSLKESSIRTALSVLGDGEITERGPSKLLHDKNNSPIFRTGSGKSVGVNQSSITKALSILGEGETKTRECVDNYVGNRGHGFSNSLFQTGSGNIVNISSAGLTRAKTLLGLEENYSPCTSQSLEHTIKRSDTTELDKQGNSQHLEKLLGLTPGTEGKHRLGSLDAKSLPKCPVNCQKDKYSSGNQSKEDIFAMCGSGSKQPPVMFQTAAGRSISVSNDALQRAMGLLGDSESGISPSKIAAYDPLFSFHKEDTTCDMPSSNKENVSYASFLPQKAATGKHLANGILPLKGTLSYQKQSSSFPKVANSESYIPRNVDENGFVSEGVCRSNTIEKVLNKDICPTRMIFGNSSEVTSRSSLGRSSGVALVDISNNIDAAYTNQKHDTIEKRRLGRRNSISPFKRPRRSRFSTPLNNNISVLSTGSSTLSTSEDSCCKTRVSTRYPFQVKRKTVKEFFGGPPCHHNLVWSLSDEVKFMTADSAENYIFHAMPGLDEVGVEALQHMLLQSGASLQNATKEWVANHYKRIVWKLACLERWYPAQTSGKYLTVANVLEELKYRYEREVNHGHRSALKRILEGDASAASMLVLCISAIRSYPDPNIGKEDCLMAPCKDANKRDGANNSESSHVARIELTDGWYSLDALLDASLSKKLVAGKLFVGQKLRIWGAGLCGWGGPVSSIEGFKAVTLLVHINGTYRAHWADKLGFCKGQGAPLAFRCIRGSGGPVPRTLVGVTRIYPILYKERLTNGSSVARSERMETKVLQLYNHKRSNIAEDIMSEEQKVSGFHYKNHSDTEEGEEIFKLLETAAEPELLMADMSSEQLISFATYQAKQKVIRESDMQKKIEKALDDAGLTVRHVTPFMKVRVVGLTRKHSKRKERPREGLITIWNPTEKQKVDLVEGQIYSIRGLIPLHSDSDIIYLQARGSTTTWQPLPSFTIENFEPFSTPRKSVLLSNLGEVPLASEFDIAAVVVYVGEVYVSGHQKKQWVFMTDGSESGTELQSEGSSNSLLAVCFCSPVTDNDSLTPISYNLTGSIVGFCNLVKQARDPVNHVWVAGATDHSTYCYDLGGCSYLKEAADSAREWAKSSSSTIQKLKERVLCIIGVCES
ncbi:protein BREAST CANCER SUSCEPTIBILITY 2 homolog B-like isoform X3 [Tasmannia lanceolata]|uniref:protein BREAST CANCER SUSCEPTIBILITY 2 homolog B-like isoform X3 n=1 Tax=Tasmannia lanceolata TaxID=3420 RepID=UPI0040638410